MKIVIEIPEDAKKAFDKATKDDINGSYYDANSVIGNAIKNGTLLPECKDCKFFEYDSFARAIHNPFIIAHEICKKWGDGCKTSEDGYCFLFEAKE